MPVTALNTRCQALRVRGAPVQKLPSNVHTDQSACMAKRMPIDAHPAPTRLRPGIGLSRKRPQRSAGPQFGMQWQAQPAPHKPKRGGPPCLWQGRALWKQLRRMQVLLLTQDGRKLLYTPRQESCVLILWGAKHTGAWEAAASLRGGARPPTSPVAGKITAAAWWPTRGACHLRLEEKAHIQDPRPSANTGRVTPNVTPLMP